MILKKGSKGEEVKVLQKFLGLTADGSFGPGTETAVKKWQTSKKLKADGVVGPSTIAKMGLVFEKESKTISTTKSPTPTKPETKPTPNAKTKTIVKLDELKENGYSLSQIQKAIQTKGYKWFEKSDYLLNIVGIRNLKQGRKVTNVFDDFLTLSYKVDGEWKFHCWNITTDPGKKAMLELKNKKGVAILKPGQYLNAYALGLHQNTYQALKQMKPVTVYRDRNKNMTFDLTSEDKGIFGINIHKAGENSNFVENWSEGCQVFKKATDFESFMTICRTASKINGNQFTYTLIESKDIQ